MTLDRTVACELTVITVAAAAFVASFQVRPPWIDFLLAALAVALVITSAGRSRRLWAFAPEPQPDAARRAWRASLAFTAAALVVLGGAALVAARAGDTSAVARFGNWHLLAAAALYFPWALLQQYLFQFYLFGRWLRLVPLPAAIVLTSLAFSAVHFPRWPVMLVTVIAGAMWTHLYHRWRRLLPLALSHAVLGTALHYWVFGNDLLERWLP